MDGTAMAGLFDAGRFTDFSFSAYVSDNARGPLVRIDAARPGPLRRELRLRGPRKPGVYGMLDRQEQLIYVGKAKNLRGRLLSYFQPHSRPAKAGKIIAQTASLVWEVCPNEFVSLLRELELIRRWRPRCNVQGQPLRRRHTFVCVGRAPAPYVFLAARPPARALAAFGPLQAGQCIGEAVRRLNDWFRLRDCSQRQRMIFPEQGELFPEVRAPGCLRMEIGTCLGPCTGTCTRRDYQAQVQAVRRFLSGKDLTPLDELEGAMQAAAAAQQFERAAVLRDRWQPLRWLADALERLRCAREQMSFVYPVTGYDGSTWWYLIHGARTIAAMPRPHDAVTRQQAAQAVRQVYSHGQAALLEPYEYADGMMVVMGWFRKYPQEKERVLTPEQALALGESEREAINQDGTN
jgi:excinuclease ABC subunit C